MLKTVDISNPAFRDALALAQRKAVILNNEFVTKTSHIKSGCKAARNLGNQLQGSVKQKLKGEEFQAPSADAAGAWTGSCE